MEENSLTNGWPLSGSRDDTLNQSDGRLLDRLAEVVANLRRRGHEKHAESDAGTSSKLENEVSCFGSAVGSVLTVGTFFRKRGV